MVSRAPHLLSLTTFLRLGNLEKTVVRVPSLGHEFVRTRNSMFVSPLQDIHRDKEIKTQGWNTQKTP